MNNVISLKRLIESNKEELLESTLRSYRAALQAMGNSGVQACPPLGEALQLGLMNLQAQLLAETTPTAVSETEQKVEAELTQWGVRSAEYYRKKTEEFKEIMMIMARTAEAVGDRDRRYSKQFTDLTSRLHSIATMDDVGRIKDSLVQSANELQAGVDKMGSDGEAVLNQMRGELRVYQTKLEEAERVASTDNLTGLQNRRRAEFALEERIKRGGQFSVLVLDLNGFKKINDTYGHNAGDEILKQFAAELRSSFRAADDVGRWGGDEFIVLVDCGLDDARRHVERVKKWVFGDYTIHAKEGVKKLPVAASIGVAEWRTGETQAEMFARADADMYREKKERKAARA